MKLKYTFNIKNIEADGWVKSSAYPMRGNKNEWVYEKRIPTHEFFTRNITIDFDEQNNIKQIFTYSGCPTRTIIDIEDLNYFFENNA